MVIFATSVFMSGITQSQGAQNARHRTASTPPKTRGDGLAEARSPHNSVKVVIVVPPILHLDPIIPVSAFSPVIAPYQP